MLISDIFHCRHVYLGDSQWAFGKHSAPLSSMETTIRETVSWPREKVATTIRILLNLPKF